MKTHSESSVVEQDRGRRSERRAEPTAKGARAGGGATTSDLPARPSSELPQSAAAEVQSALAVQLKASAEANAFEQDPFGLATAQDGVRGDGASLPFMDAIQASFGPHDVSGIEAHVGGDAATAASAIGADAYATGNHVAFKSTPDLHTAAHEAAHVVQQRGGVQLKGGFGEAGDAYEQHADAVADRVVRGESAADLLDGMAGGGTVAPAVQRKATKDPLEELRGLDTVIGAHVDVIVETLAQDAVPHAAGRNIAPSVRTVADLLWKAADIVRGLPRQTRPDDMKDSVDRIEDRIEALMHASRRALVHMVPSGLDAVFAAEDAMLIAAGGQAANRRAGFYGDRTASDLAGIDRARGQDPGETGGELVERIQRWFSHEPLRHSLGLIDLLPILQEPARTREPSAFESLLAAVANHVVGLLPGYLSGLLGSVITDGAARVAEQATALTQSPSGRGPRGFPMNTDPSYGDRQKASDAGSVARLTAKHPEVLQAVRAFAQISPLAGKHVVAPVADKVSGRLTSQVGSTTRGGDGETSEATNVKDDRRPLSTAFVTHVTQGLHSYVDASVDRVSQLGRALELFPPLTLATIYDGLTAGAKAVAARLRGDLVAEWASFVAAASLGEDKAGNLAGQGTLQNLVEMPGVVQISMRVTRGRGLAVTPRVDVQSIAMNGMSESAIFELRRSARPLQSVALHRVVNMTLEDGYTGIDLLAGRFALSPEHAVDLDDASWSALAQIASGTVPDERAPPLQERIARKNADRDQIAAAAVLLLTLANKTTADIP